MQVISDLYNFRCINHLIASSRNLNKTSKKMPKFTHACMEAFMAMKFKVKNPLSWEFSAFGGVPSGPACSPVGILPLWLGVFGKHAC